MEERLQYRTCDHLKQDGIYCGSPALYGRNYCYYHLSLRGRGLARAQARRNGQAYRVQLPLLENMHAVQAALHEVLQSLADGQTDVKTAGIMLYGLQQASANLNNRQWQGECRELHFAQEGRALDYPNFEQQFGIPPGIDLNATPEAALEQAETHPETLSQPEQKPAPLQQPRPGVRIRRPSSIARDLDDPDHEPTFEELQRQLDKIQGLVDQGTETKKPPAPAAQKEDQEVFERA